MADNLEIWADDDVEADWFQRLDSRLLAARVQIIGSRGTNHPVVDDLIAYDRPDVILLEGGVARLVLEKTREVPTGHNVGQRMARLVRAVERGVPTIKFFPFDARKHGTYSNMCYMNVRLLRAFMNMTSLHDTPVLAINWPIDQYGELVIDGSENTELAQVVGSLLESGFDRGWSGARAVLAGMDEEYRMRLNMRLAYGQVPPSVRSQATADYLASLALRIGQADATAMRGLLNRPETLVYRIGMRPEHARREDPYTGTQFIYDYTDCRSGPSVAQKRKNLVLDLPLISKATWLTLNPNDPTRKSSNWYLTANALVFADGASVLRLSE